MPADTASKAARKPQARSRVTNGSKLAPGMDGRSRWARRLRDVMALYADDLDGEVSQMKGSLIRRAATLTVELERAEEAFAEAGEADPEALRSYQTTANTLRRLLETLGLTRKTISDVPDAALTINGTHVLRRDPEAVGVPVDRREQFDLARRIAWAAEMAVQNNTPLPEGVARLLVDLGLADRIVPVADEDGKVVVSR